MSSKCLVHKRFEPEFKKGIRLVEKLGRHPVEVARDVDVSATTVRRWIREYGTKGNSAFPEKGNLHPADEETLKTKKANQGSRRGERHSQKSYGHLRQGREISCLFIKGHRSAFSVTATPVLDISCYAKERMYLQKTV